MSGLRLAPPHEPEGEHGREGERGQRGGRGAACLAELHRNLERKKGDDDISFIWLYPSVPTPGEGEGPEPLAAEPPEGVAGGEMPGGRSDGPAATPGDAGRNWLVRLLAGLLNFLKRGAW